MEATSTPVRADLIITGGRVETLDAAWRTASAIAVADERILAVGEDDAIRALADSRTRVIDARGRRRQRLIRRPRRRERGRPGLR